MPTTVEVRFKGNRKDYYLWPDGADPLHLRDAVIVETERGLDLGRVSVTGETAARKCAAGCGGCAVGETRAAERSVVRLASQEEIKVANELRRSEEETRIKAIERVRHHGLEMKVSDAEWQWDRKKLTIYFTAEKRVDFRDLVRDLASTFKTRIELRQIGVRDEAARLGGVGRCGKEFCCSTWLKELNPVSLSLAKDQHLSLNPAQISGGCGRLLCCLKYEHEFYVASRKRFPKEGKTLRTARGTEKVVAVDIFRERVFLRHEEEGPRIVSLVSLKDELAGMTVETASSPVPPPPAPSPAARPAAPKAEQPEPSQAALQPPKKRSKRRRRRRGPRDGPNAAPPGES
jgi:cell fate regulator YaaT (PSP1 superfamily)